MAIYMDEEEVWKCPKHPSKRRRNGICPTCLRDRLVTLCPDCANVRPCACCPASSSSSSASSASSASSSFSFFSSASSSRRVGRVSDLIEKEPAFRRSISVGIPFLFTRFARERQAEDSSSPSAAAAAQVLRRRGRMTSSLLSRFWWSKSRKREECGGEQRDGEDDRRNSCSNASIEEFANMMNRSRSVSAAAKGKGWNFSSPMRVFRKMPNLPGDRTPMIGVEWR